MFAKKKRALVVFRQNGPYGERRRSCRQGTGIAQGKGHH